MVEEMGMTNKQFQGFLRLIINLIDKAIEESPDNKTLVGLKDSLQAMLEDS